VPASQPKTRKRDLVREFALEDEEGGNAGAQKSRERELFGMAVKQVDGGIG